MPVKLTGAVPLAVLIVVGAAVIAALIRSFGVAAGNVLAAADVDSFTEYIESLTAEAKLLAVEEGSWNEEPLRSLIETSLVEELTEVE